MVETSPVQRKQVHVTMPQPSWHLRFVAQDKQCDEDQNAVKVNL